MFLTFSMENKYMHANKIWKTRLISRNMIKVATDITYIQKSDTKWFRIQLFLYNKNIKKMLGHSMYDTVPFGSEL